MFIPAVKRYKLFMFIFLFSFSLNGQNCLIINSPGTSQVMSVGDTATFTVVASELDTNFNANSVHIQLKKSAEVVQEVIILFDSSPFTYSFEMPCVSSSDAGNYFFLLTPKCIDDCNCDDGTISSGVSSLTITDAAEFQIQTDPPNASEIDCINATLGLSIDYQGSPILWSNGVTGQSIVANDGGFYTAYMDLANGCEIEEEIEIDDLRTTIIPDFDQTGFPIIDCVDEFTIDLTPVSTPVSNGPFLYNWEGPGTIDNSSAEDPLIKEMVGGTYFVTITDINSGCTGSDSFDVEINSEMPSAIIQSSANAITCFDNLISLDGTLSSGPLSGIKYLWSTPNGNIISNNDLSIVQIDDGGIYHLTITSLVGDGCVHDTTIIIGENLFSPEIDLMGGPSFCVGASTTLIANNLVPDIEVEYEWTPDPGNGNMLEVFAEGDYSVIATNTLNGCTAEEYIFLEENPSPVLTLGTTQYSIANGDVLSIPFSDSVAWNIVESTNINNSIDQSSGNFDITASLLEVRTAGSIIYEVALINAGCQSNTEEITVHVFPQDPDLFIPDLISPNADGMNDNWNVLFPNPNDASNFQLKIFNRSGGLVHQSPDMTIPWSADDCADGTYYYVIAGNGIVKKGAVTVIRK